MKLNREAHLLAHAMRGAKKCVVNHVVTPVAATPFGEGSSET